MEYFPEDVLPLTGASKLFIMVGVNDIALYGGIDRTMEVWAEFAERVCAACPDLQLFIESNLPIWHGIEYPGLSNSFLLTYNERLKAFCEENGFVYVDIADYFRDDTGGIALEYSSDAYVHVTYAAAAVWVEQLKNPVNYSVDPRSF